MTDAALLAGLPPELASAPVQRAGFARGVLTAQLVDGRTVQCWQAGGKVLGWKVIADVHAAPVALLPPVTDGSFTRGRARAILREIPGIVVRGREQEHRVSVTRGAVCRDCR